MRRAVLFVLMISLALLAGCGNTAKQDEERVEQFRQQLSQALVITVTAEIRADYGDTVAEFVVACTAQGDEISIEIVQPEMVAGVKARLTGEDARLEYEDIILDAGVVTSDDMSPVSALPSIIASLKEGYLKATWRESEGDDLYLVAQMTVSDSVMQAMWFSYPDMIPKYCEIRSGEHVTVYCAFTDWKAQ